MNLKFLRSLFILFMSLSIFSCTEDSLPGPEVNPGTPIDGEIWTGADLSFTKAPGTIASQEANQDRITDNVWITRGNSGQIFNVKVESNANKRDSPVGTEWAQGSIDDIASLTFRPFRTAVGDPKSVVGKNLVLHLIDDDIYLSVRFTSWQSGGGGGFAYERSTP